MRTASAEADFQEVEAGKGTPACIKLTQRLLMENNAVSLNQMAYGNSRKLAAQKFYSSLVMLKHEVIEAQQNEPFGDVIITKGSNFGAEILDHC
jgi:cohesin complex subunit SCC1